ncbi:MAG: hypothetical protein V3V04_03815 [Rhizobiaceae bacterium]
MFKAQTVSLFAVLLFCSSPIVSAAELDLEGASSLGNPYCIDMRILSERKRAVNGGAIVGHSSVGDLLSRAV